MVAVVVMVVMVVVVFVVVVVFDVFAVAVAVDFGQQQPRKRTLRTMLAREGARHWTTPARLLRLALVRHRKDHNRHPLLLCQEGG